jgi:hypothetical protein
MTDDNRPFDLDNGCFRTRIEEPDLMVSFIVGVLDRDKLLEISELMRQRVGHWPYVLSILNLTKMTRITPEARRAAHESGQGIIQRGTAFVGGSFTLRSSASCS